MKMPLIKISPGASHKYKYDQVKAGASITL